MKINRYFLILLILETGNCYAESRVDTIIKNSVTYKMQPIQMQTRWANSITPEKVLDEYPRPQMERDNWQNLNGLWEYAITDSTIKTPKTYDGLILVPYPVESALSGVQRKLLPTQILWYKRNIEVKSLKKNDKLILNFGAVDWQATVFINNKIVANHINGYQQFSIDITDNVHVGNNEILVKVYDPTDQGLNPHGKQALNPGNIYYTPSSGIWQTVWLEKVPLTNISQIKTIPNIDKGTLSIQITTDNPKANMEVEAIASANGKTTSAAKIKIRDVSGRATIDLHIPNARLWSPDEPFLYDLQIKLTEGGKVTDQIKSYFGMRKINIQKDEKGADRIFLNNKYTFNLGILDQGFWPEGLYTAPSDDALIFDIKAIKAMGFNTIRKHIKLESERWYYHTDKIGILVWQDFVNPPHGLPNGSKPIFEKEIKETIDQLYNHPSIISWVIFNERWGAYDQPRITEWVKKYDPSRIINGHSGELLYVNNELREPSTNPWFGSDVTDVHSYPDPRNPPGQPGKAKVVGEFGGIGVSVPNHQWDDLQGWGYVQATPIQLKEKYKDMILALKKLETEGLSAAIYTQPFDVEGEENGLLTYDREIIKMPLNDIQEINKNLVPISSAFTLDTNFILAKNINVNDTDNNYPELLKQFERGNRDSTFLRRTTLIALRKEDQENATLLGNEYISVLTQPLSKENLIFISKITNTTKDKGFKIFNIQAEKVNEVMGRIYAEYKVKGIIEKEELSSYLANKNIIPAWDSIQLKLSSKYGLLGEELVLGKRMIFYYRITKDWKNFGKYYMLYFKKAMKHPDYITNNLSWAVFQHVNDVKVLEFAVEVMKNDLDTWDKYSSQAYDTYANLLHKLNKSTEAIKWEEKAIQLKANAAEEEVFVETLQKMKAGLPTWPQNN